MKESFECHNLPLSERRSVITLLPKGKGDDLKSLKMWRPLSLTNTGYKLITRALAKRIMGFVKKIVSNSQVGYIEGRSINDHIRLIDDILCISNMENLFGTGGSLDFQKAFDTVSRKSIFTSLKQFNFGDNFVGYVKTILNNSEAAMKNANFYSDFFCYITGGETGLPFITNFVCSSCRNAFN